MDRANIHNITYRDIRLEFSKHDCKAQSKASDTATFVPTVKDPVAVKIFMDCGMWSSDKIRGKISDVTFEDIKITTDYDYKVNFIFNGLDEEHNASNIIFKNITLNGKTLTKKDDFNISSNQFVDFKIS
jgi:hypothetical protein